MHRQRFIALNITNQSRQTLGQKRKIKTTSKGKGGGRKGTESPGGPGSVIVPYPAVTGNALPSLPAIIKHSGASLSHGSTRASFYPTPPRKKPTISIPQQWWTAARCGLMKRKPTARRRARGSVSTGHLVCKCTQNCG